MFDERNSTNDRKETDAFARWQELRKSIKPLGMNMKEAIAWGRRF
jgi:hypothetical protein